MGLVMSTVSHLIPCSVCLMYRGQCVGCFLSGSYDLIRVELKLCYSAMVVTGFVTQTTLEIFHIKHPTKCLTVYTVKNLK